MEGRDLWGPGSSRSQSRGAELEESEDRITWDALGLWQGAGAAVLKGGSEPTGSLAPGLDLGSRRWDVGFGRGAGRG